MKHLFIVHSHITYLATLGVIISEELDLEDVYIVSNHYKMDSSPVKINQIPIRKGFSGLFNPYKEVDCFLFCYLKNDNFIVYTPSFSMMARLFVVHPNCIKFNIIEEGLSSYYDYFDLYNYTLFIDMPWHYDKGVNGIVQRLRSFKRVCAISPKIDTIPYLYYPFAQNPEVICYGLHSLAHASAVNKKLLSLEDISRKFPFETYVDLSDQYVWIGDPRDKKISLEEYLGGFEKSYIPYLFSQGKDFTYLKFHPRENQSSRIALMNLLEEKKIKYEIIPDDVILELVLLKSRNITLCGVYSSLLWYGSIFNHTSLSIINHLDTGSLLRHVHVSNYWKMVQKI